MLTADFDYELPPERIAQTPLAERDQARLLVDAGPGRRPHHAVVRDLPALLAPGDVVVVNDTRVLPARVAVRRASGGAAEVLLLERVDGWWEALVRPSRKLKPGEVVHAGEDAAIEIGDDLGEGRRRVRFVASRDLADDLATLDLAGTVPLPPYITEPLDDDERYQTVYAHHPGSAAAPTAGLHLTEAVLEVLRARQIRVETVDLQVGLGTFRPIATDAVDDHVMHRERYAVPVSTQAAIAARPPGARVVAVGTTTLRALEAWAATGAAAGHTDLFIRRPYRFAVVDLLLTNFHLPRSSLLVLIDAFVGPRWRELYASALAEDYRFLSFGDAMLLTRTADGATPGAQIGEATSQSAEAAGS